MICGRSNENSSSKLDYYDSNSLRNVYNLPAKRRCRLPRLDMDVVSLVNWRTTSLCDLLAILKPFYRRLIKHHNNMARCLIGKNSGNRARMRGGIFI